MPTKTPEVADLIKAGLHFGHKTEKWNPKMKPYLYGKKNGVHIFDLNKTAELLVQALDFLTKSASEGKVIMLVSTKQQTLDILPAIADKLGLPYVTEKWFGGLLTNWETTKSRIRELQNLKRERDETAFAKYVKSERNRKLKQIDRLELWLSGIEALDKRPDVLFVLDTLRDKLAVREAGICGIPTVGMSDSNTDPDVLTYPIPGNDDAVKAIDYILNAVNDAIEEGQKNPIKPVTKEKDEAPTEGEAKEEPILKEESAKKTEMKKEEKS